MKNNNEEGITLLQIFKVMLGRKLLLLIVTIAIAIVGTLAILFGFNNMTQTYSTTFGYSNSNLFNGKYVDGSAFNYQSLISEEAIKNIVKSDSQFNSIDVDDMIDAEAITITINQTINQTMNEIIISDKDYTITVQKKYFKNKNQAKSFVKAITEIPVKKNDQIVENVKSDDYLVNYKSSKLFIAKANTLVNQYDYLMASYTDLISNYGDVVNNDTGISLSLYKNRLEAFYNENQIDALDEEIMNNIYVLDYESNKEEINNQYEYYTNKYNSNVKKINALQEMVTSLMANTSNTSSMELSDYNALIAKYTIENVEYQHKIKYYANALGKYETTDSNYVPKATTKENETFEEKLNYYYDLLNEFTNTYTKAASNAIKSNNKVYYNSANIVSINGGIGALLALVISLVLGFVIACITNLIVDRKKLISAYNNEPIKETKNSDTDDNTKKEASN